MLRLKAERRSLAKVSGASAPSQSAKRDIGVSDSSTETAYRLATRTFREDNAPRHRRWKHRRTIAADLASWLVMFVIVAAVLLAGSMLLVLIWPAT